MDIVSVNVTNKDWSTVVCKCVLLPCWSLEVKGGKPSDMVKKVRKSLDKYIAKCKKDNTCYPKIFDNDYKLSYNVPSGY